MVDVPYTQPRQVQYRGPSTSDDYNARIEENYQDLLVLLNRAGITEGLLQEYYSRVVKDQLSLIRVLEDLESRIAALEEDKRILSFFSDSQVDNDRFNSTSFNISTTARCTADTRSGFIVLPKVESSSLSKLSFTDNLGVTRLPSTLETSILGLSPGADSVGALIDTTPAEFAIRGGTGRIWERNVVVNAPDGAYASMYLYVKVPTDLFTTDKSNVVTVNPFPSMGVDLLDVSTTSIADPLMADSDGYVPLNSTAHYAGQQPAVGWVPPGGWGGDAILDCGPKKFYFDPQLVTGFRLKFQQRDYYQENGKYIYSYGASFIDLGFDKFLTTGKTMLRFDAVDTLINSVDDVEPQIFNVAESELPNVFSYRVIWETSLNSGVYTTTPVSLSSRVWIEVTLTGTVGGGTPALSGLTVSYS